MIWVSAEGGVKRAGSGGLTDLEECQGIGLWKSLTMI